MKLFFSDNFSRQRIIKLIHNEIRTKEEQINQLKNSLNHWKTQGISKLQKITVGYGLTEYRATVKYLKEQLKNLEDDKNSTQPK